MKRSINKALILIALAVAATAVIAVVRMVTMTPRGFAVVQPGALYRSRQPRGRQWDVLKPYGIGTVIDLRPVGEDPKAFEEETRICAEAGAELVHIPIGRMPPTDEQIGRFLQAVRSRRGAALVHCQHGKTRTGFLVAAYRAVAQDWPVEQAIDEMVRLGDSQTASLREQAAAILGRLKRDRPHRPRPATAPTTTRSAG